MSRIRDIANILSGSTDMATDAELASHAAAADPHTVYLKTATASSTYTPLSSAAANQIMYKNSSNVASGSSGLQYDGTSIKVNGNLESVYTNGDEGGEIFLNKATTNTTITNGVTVDVFQNRLRFFENGGSNRGYYLDIASGGNSAGTNLGSSGGMTLLGSSINTSGTSAVNFNSISQSYTDLVIYITNAKLTASGTISLRMNNDATNANYQYNSVFWTGSTPSFGLTNAVPNLVLWGNITTPTGRNGYTAVITIPRYSLSSVENTQYFAQVNSGSTALLIQGSWSVNSGSASNTAINSVNLTTNQSFSAGDFYLYGVK